MRTALLMVTLTATAAVAPVSAQPGTLEFLRAGSDRGAAIVNPDECPGGLRYDDGSYEGAVGYANAVPRGAYVMAVDIPARFEATATCLCWTRTSFSNGTGLDYDVVFYAPDGEEGQPGTLLGRLPARANAVPQFDTEGVALYRVPLPALDFPLAGRIYIGAEWQPFVDRQFFLCNDASEATPLREAWSSIDGLEWTPTSKPRPSYRALALALLGESPARPVPLTWPAAGIAVLLLVAASRRLRRRPDRPGNR